MTNARDHFTHSLADLRLVSSRLLLAGLFRVYRSKQPAPRIAVARSIVVGLATLAVVVATPGWPRTEWPRGLGDDVTFRLSNATRAGE
jgi:hypothetical protein